MSAKFLKDLAERSVATFLQSFAAAWLVFADGRTDDLFAWPIVKVGLIAGAIAVAKGVVASRKGQRDSASLVNEV